MTQSSSRRNETSASTKAESLEYLYRDGKDARRKFWDHLLLGWSHSTALTWHETRVWSDWHDTRGSGRATKDGD